MIDSYIPSITWHWLDLSPLLLQLESIEGAMIVTPSRDSNSNLANNRIAIVVIFASQSFISLYKAYFHWWQFESILEIDYKNHAELTMLTISYFV